MLTVQITFFSLWLSVLSSSLYAATELGVPPSWNATAPAKTTYDRGDILGEGYKSKPKKTSKSVVKGSLGIFTGFPDGRGIEGQLFLGKYIGFRGFYAPSMPIKVRVEMPSEVLSAKQGIAVANPAYTILGELTTGANSGGELLAFPFGGSFYLSLGAATRKASLSAHAQSPVLICSVLEAQKEDPCSDPQATLKTRVEAEIDAAITTQALLLKAGLGWYWHISRFGYFTLAFGAGKPSKVTRSATANANIVVPGEDDTAITGALLELKKTRESDLAQKAEKAISPFDQKILPVAALGLGLRI